MPDISMQPDDLNRRRARALRTAWLLAALAASIFAAFVLTGVVGR